MKRGCAYTPKYWIGHSLKEDDVFLTTAKKSYQEAHDAMNELLGEEWTANAKYEIMLFGLMPEET